MILPRSWSRPARASISTSRSGSCRARARSRTSSPTRCEWSNVEGSRSSTMSASLRRATSVSRRARPDRACARKIATSSGSSNGANSGAAEASSADQRQGVLRDLRGRRPSTHTGRCSRRTASRAPSRRPSRSAPPARRGGRATSAPSGAKHRRLDRRHASGRACQRPRRPDAGDAVRRGVEEESHDLGAAHEVDERETEKAISPAGAGPNSAAAATSTDVENVKLGVPAASSPRTLRSSPNPAATAKMSQRRGAPRTGICALPRSPTRRRAPQLRRAAPAF